MTERDALTELLAQVEAATKGNVQLDTLLWQSGLVTTEQVSELIRYPGLTTSVDAALALIEKRLAGWGALIAWRREGCIVDLSTKPLGNREAEWPAHAKGKTLPLALIAALLKAEIARISTEAMPHD